MPNNWATDNVDIWFSNDEPLYLRKMALIHAHGHRLTADHVRDLVLQVFPAGTPDMRSAAGLSSVNYHQLAEEWKEEL